VDKKKEEEGSEETLTTICLPEATYIPVFPVFVGPKAASF
jgi:hypothetical protein